MVVELLCSQCSLPAIYKDHALINSRNYKNVRECHIEPDWLLVYQVFKDELILRLIRTGTHSDLFVLSYCFACWLRSFLVLRRRFCSARPLAMYC